MIAIITLEQKQLLENIWLTNDIKFNPILDLNDNWVISEDEINLCDNEDFLWVKNLTLSVYCKKINLNIFSI